MKILAAILMVLAFSAPTMAQTTHSRCEIRGTPEGDIISGDDHANSICARAGGDYVSGRAGKDRMRGGQGNDTIIGGSQHDRILGRGGDDRLFAIDGKPGDTVIGGRGFDRCYGEKGDRFRCERVVTNMSPTYPLAAVLALSKALEKTVQHANVLLCERDKTLCLNLGVGTEW